MARLIVGAAGAFFIILCLLAYRQSGLSGFDAVLAQPWGVVTLMDVMLGAVCMGAVIFSQEQDKRVALAWTLAIFPLGHVVSVAWLLARFLPQKAA